MSVAARLATFAAAAALGLAGCASGGSAGGGTGRPSGAHTPVPRKISVGAARNGGSVTVRVGDVVSLRLASTYWRIAPAAPAAVLRTDSRTTTPAPSCAPGQGCGTAAAAFTAVAPGRASVSASRTSCGEALRCGPAQSRYRLTVLVRRP